MSHPVRVKRPPHFRLGYIQFLGLRPYWPLDMTLQIYSRRVIQNLNQVRRASPTPTA